MPHSGPTAVVEAQDGEGPRPRVYSDASTVPLVELQVSQFAFPAGSPVLGRVAIDLHPGSIVGLMGPNGCGKSTLLSLLAGERASPSVVRRSAVRDDRIALVVQDYRSSLFAWKTGLENLVLPLVLRGEERSAAEGRATALATDLGLTVPQLARLPQRLSGGEQQKLTVVRALLEAPRVLLLDESFSAMDFRSWLLFTQRLRHRLQHSDTATLLVSHSAEQAFEFCDRLLLMTAEGLIGDEIPDCQSAANYGSNIERVHAHFVH